MSDGTNELAEALKRKLAGDTPEDNAVISMGEPDVAPVESLEAEPPALVTDDQPAAAEPDDFSALHPQTRGRIKVAEERALKAKEEAEALRERLRLAEIEAAELRGRQSAQTQSLPQAQPQPEPAQERDFEMERILFREKAFDEGLSEQEVIAFDKQSLAAQREHDRQRRLAWQQQEVARQQEAHINQFRQSVAAAHPDLPQIVNSPAFDKFLQENPNQAAALHMGTQYGDVAVTSGVLQDFKRSQVVTPPAKPLTSALSGPSSSSASLPAGSSTGKKPAMPPEKSREMATYILQGNKAAALAIRNQYT